MRAQVIPPKWIALHRSNESSTTTTNSAFFIEEVAGSGQNLSAPGFCVAFTSCASDSFACPVLQFTGLYGLTPDFVMLDVQTQNS
jgi:hypothetical protein